MNYDKARAELEEMLHEAINPTALTPNVGLARIGAKRQVERIIEQLEKPRIASLVETLSLGDNYG